MRPVYLLLREMDGEKTLMGSYYRRMFEARKELCSMEGLSHDCKAAVLDAFDSRWAGVYSDIHGAAYCLSPANIGHVMVDYEDEVVSSLRKMISKVFWRDADGNLDLAGQALVEYERFKSRDDELGTLLMVKMGKVLQPHRWWSTHGNSMPVLRSVALNILPVLTTATSSKRAWSAQGVVQSARRMALGVETIRRLVKVYLNLRLE